MAQPNTQSNTSKPHSSTDPRDAAYRYLARQCERMPELMLTDLHTGSLEHRDTALALAIVDAVITRWITLDYILSTLSGRILREQEPRMQAVLLGGAAQLLLMDRVPPHAIIDESVEWAKTNIRPKAGGMVNAILRKVSRTKGTKRESWDHHLDAIPLADGTSLGLVGIELPQSGLERLSIACSIPTQLVQRLENQFGDPTYQTLHTLKRAPTLLCVAHARETIDLPILRAHDSPSHRVFVGKRTELVELLESRNDIWVQDAASSRAIDELDVENAPSLIIDLCAGQGTKTRQLCAKYPQAQIIAGEIDEARLSTLATRFGGNAQVKVMHIDELFDAQQGVADIVLTDVPCSNTGVLARRREARYRPMKQQLARLVPIQQGIVRQGYSLLKAGGTLVYSTCSLEHDENEDMVQWMVSKCGLLLTNEHRTDPNGLGQDPNALYHDGAFSAVLSKVD
jgi:16S rRNA (cytosine967-C5)-methyltransferase